MSTGQELSNTFDYQKLQPGQILPPTFSVVPQIEDPDQGSSAAPLQLPDLVADTQIIADLSVPNLDVFGNAALTFVNSKGDHSKDDPLVGLVPQTIGIAPSDSLGNSSNELVFVDLNVPDYASLLSGINPSAKIIFLNPDRDGVEQISEALAQHKDVSGVHILSHGSAGQLQLGNSTLSSANIGSYSQQLQSWQAALTDEADILLYGCNVAEGAIGDNFIRQISTITGADVVASTNITGNTALGGDWILEDRTGAIETDLAVSSAAQSSYSSVLVTAVTMLNFSPVGTLMLDSFDDAASNNYMLVGLANSVVLRRVDNAVINDMSTSDATVLQRNIVWLQDVGGMSAPAPTQTEEALLLGTDFAIGTDNLFKNDGASTEQYQQYRAS